MLESLLEIEIAYSLLKSEDGSADGVSPIDTHYKQLKTDMTVLNRDSDEFKLLSKYVKNTHAATHQQYDLEIQEVYNLNLIYLKIIKCFYVFYRYLKSRETKKIGVISHSKNYIIVSCCGMVLG